MKRIAIIAVLLMLFGCGGSSGGGARDDYNAMLKGVRIPDSQGYCYLISGLYLAGDSWKRVGKVNKVFNAYNMDSDLILKFYKYPDQRMLWCYQRKGLRVVIGYKTDGL